MKLAYIGEVETKAKAIALCSRYSRLIVSGITESGRYELSVATESERLIDMYQSALTRNKLY